MLHLFGMTLVTLSLTHFKHHKYSKPETAEGQTERAGYTCRDISYFRFVERWKINQIEFVADVYRVEMSNNL